MRSWAVGVALAAALLGCAPGPALVTPRALIVCPGPSHPHLPGPTSHPGCVDPWELNKPAPGWRTMPTP